MDKRHKCASQAYLSFVQPRHHHNVTACSASHVGEGIASRLASGREGSAGAMQTMRSCSVRQADVFGSRLQLHRRTQRQGSLRMQARADKVLIINTKVRCAGAVLEACGTTMVCKLTLAYLCRFACFCDLL